MSDYSELKRLAEAAKDDPNSPHIPCQVAFQRMASPEVVIELIKDLERHQRMLLVACMDMGAIGSALDADMNSDGEELLSKVVDLKAQNKRLRGFLSGISKTSGDKGAVMGARQLLKEFGQ
jgi:hypothetical protein